MRTIFAGPSLYGVNTDLSNLDVRPPAAQGDLLAAVFDGAAVIGLIDGAFEATASVWHKEILFALHEGVAVVGGGSMGALRAAECAAFGMIAVGTVARRYLDGSADDDALVAVTHGPAELGSPPLSEALVDCEATLDAMQKRGVIAADEARRMTDVARRMFYKERTIAALAAAVHPEAPDAFEAAYRQHRVSLKSADAGAVVAAVQALPDRRKARQLSWALSEPPLWLETLEQARAQTRASRTQES